MFDTLIARIVFLVPGMVSSEKKLLILNALILDMSGSFNKFEIHLSIICLYRSSFQQDAENSQHLVISEPMITVAIAGSGSALALRCPLRFYNQNLMILD